MSDPAPLSCTGTITLVCPYSYAVGGSGTNTATVTYSANGDTETLSPTADYTLAITNIDDTATLTDVYDGGASKSLPPSKQTYTKTFSCGPQTEGGVNPKDGTADNDDNDDDDDDKADHDSGLGPRRTTLPPDN